MKAQGGKPALASAAAVNPTNPRMVPAEMSMFPVKMRSDRAMAPTMVGLTSSIRL